MSLRPLALLLPLLAACAPPGGTAPETSANTGATTAGLGSTSALLPNVGPVGYRDATLANAPFTLGRTDLLAGDPLRAAAVAGDLERLTYAAEVDPFFQTARDSLLQPVLQIGRRQMRGALGIPDRASPERVIPALAAAAEALSWNDRPRAAAVLATVGSPDTLDRLSNLPRLRRVEEAGQRAGQEFNRGGRDRG